MERLDACVEAYISEGDSVRAKIIVAAAEADYQLGEMLRAFLLPTSRSADEDPLLGRERPLFSFSSRIEACHRLGLVGPRLTGVLYLIRDMRNKAAHYSEPVDLDSGPFAGWFSTVVQHLEDPRLKSKVAAMRPREKGLQVVFAVVMFLLSTKTEHVVRLVPIAPVDFTDQAPAS